MKWVPVSGSPSVRKFSFRKLPIRFERTKFAVAYENNELLRLCLFLHNICLSVRLVFVSPFFCLSVCPSLFLCRVYLSVVCLFVCQVIYVFCYFQDICDNPQLFVEGMDCGDVHQGRLGNCWFVAACSCLTLYKEIWTKVRNHWKFFPNKFHFRKKIF